MPDELLNEDITPAGDPPAGDPPAGDPPAGDPPADAGDPPAGAGDPPAGDPPAGDPPADDPPAELGNLPDNWREIMANGDDKKLAYLKRFKSHDTFLNAQLAQNQRARESTKAPTLPDNATPEQVAAYRKATGIPENAADYGLAFPEGFEAQDADNDLMGEFGTFMHENNVPPGAAQRALEWYSDYIDQDRQTKNARAVQQHQEASDQLALDWGKDFDGNTNAVKKYLNDMLGEDQANAFRALQLPDGSLLGNNIDMMKLLVTPAVDNAGPNFIYSSDTAETAKTLQERKDELQGMRLTDPTKWKSDDVQKELHELYGRINRIKQQEQG